MSDLFINDDKEIKTRIRPAKAPSGYIAINLSSNGKLGVPAKIHVRNYNGQDALDLAMATDEDMFEVLVNVLSDMIYEDIDTDDLHEQDLQEIMLNVYFNFWASHLEYPYIPSEEELLKVDDIRRERIKSGGESLTMKLTSDQIITTNLMDFEEPIKINMNDSEYSFILPRIGHTLNAKFMTEEKFANDEVKFSDLQVKLENNQERIEKGEPPVFSINPSEKRKFTKYQKDRMKYFTLLIQAQLIQSVEGETFTEIKQKEEAYKIIALDVWREYNKVLKEKAKFGISNTVKVISPLTKELVERRVVFRPMDFLPSMEP